MGASEVINESTADDTSLRIKLPVKAAYGVAPDIIRNILMDAAHNTEAVLKDKKINVVLSDFQHEQQVTFTLMCWVADPNKKSGALSALREKIYIRFLNDNIPISAPTKNETNITKQANLTQEIAITAIPSVSIKDIPELIQSVAIKDIPELIQSITIKDMPDRNGTLSIKEIPDLFGSGKARKIPKVETPLTQRNKKGKE
jgi:hypothetical protein